MKENMEENKKECLIWFRTKKAKLLFCLWSAILLVIFMYTKWLFKIRLYIHSVISWIFILLFIAGIHLIVKRINFIDLKLFKETIFKADNDMPYIEKNRICKEATHEKSILIRVLKWMLISGLVAAIIGMLFSSPIAKGKYFSNKLSDEINIIEETDESSAFPNLLGENNDTSNLPIYGIPEALKKSETQMGTIPALGTQFEVREKDVTSQNINNELKYVIPLQPKNWLKWDDSGNQGYFIVDRNTGDSEFVKESLATTSKAPFGDNTKRLIYKYMNQENISGLITDISPEVDEKGEFHYVATVYENKGISGFSIVTGIIEVDAKTKACTYYNLDEIPKYVDRVYPEWVFTNYLKYYGLYKKGFINSLFGQKGCQKPTKDSDIIYIDGICYYYTGFTSTGKAESSNGIMMMNSRTGEISYYKTNGLSEERAREVAEGVVQEKEYVASYPLLLTIGNEETYFMLMRDKSDNLTGYAFVSYKDYTKSSVATSLLDAQAQYVKSLSKSNSTEVLDESNSIELNGVISDIASENIDGTTVYYVKIEGSDKIFQMFSELNLDIVFANIGDKIKITYFDSNSKVETIIFCEL